MKKLTLLALFAVLGSACTAGIPEEGESIEGISDAIIDCNTNNGLLPTKASLAVAMANELKRWDPITDLVHDKTNDMIALSAAGLQRCTAMNSTCANTKALLNLQYWSDTVDQNVFNSTTYRNDLIASLNRAFSRHYDLQRNNPGALPAAHNLTKVGGPTNLGIGACGPHYLYKPTKPDGSAYPNPGNLANNLYFFGYPSNNHLAFTVTNGNVGVDPLDGDNSTPTTTSGSCPTYDLDRVYNPTNALLGTCCVTVLAKNGALQGIPRAAGYLGCKAGVVPTR